MKIKVTKADYEDVVAKKVEKHQTPVKQGKFWRWLLSTLSKSELKAVNFTCEKTGLEGLEDKEPCLYLMNHSSFTDLMIVASLLKDKEYHIVCTNDGFVGKDKILRKIGCIPTKKFITDITLVKDMKYTFEKLKASVVLYPEASYSFDGTETPLPSSLGKCVKMMNVPVVMIRTSGAFLRDPLYNKLQKRKANVSAKMELIISREECSTLSPDDIQKRIQQCFVYDHFKEQKENNIIVDEPFRADGLHRVLYKCANCGNEGDMEGLGIEITCNSCGHKHILKEDGTLQAKDGDTRFKYVTDWYAWERECVRKEIEAGEYSLDTDVDILMLVDTESVYDVGEGHLHHDKEGFSLRGCNDRLDFKLKSSSLYSLYSDYFWYELGDMVSIGDNSKQFYCFAKEAKNLIAAKARLATEEIYKMN